MPSLRSRLWRPTPSKQQETTALTLGDLDIVSRLPYELRAIILAELSLVELLAALNVSRRWRANWLGDETWPSLSELYFPGLAAHIRAVHASSPDDGRRPAESELFRRALHRIPRRSEGRFAFYMHHAMTLQPDVTFFRLDRSLPVNQGGVHRLDDAEEFPVDLFRYPRFMMYNNGRVAWWPDPAGTSYLAVVDDLRARSRRVFLFPGHGGVRNGYRTSMSDRLFVMARDRTVHVWHLERSCLRSILLPEQVERCMLEGENALLVSRSAHIYLWAFERPQEVREVDLTRLDFYSSGSVVMGGLVDLSHRFYSHDIGLRFRNTGMLIDFILHPALEDAFFVITMGSEAPRKLTVYEVRDNAHTGSYVLEHPLVSTTNIEDVGYLRWEKIDSYGGYCLVHSWLDDMTTNEARDMSGADTPLLGCSSECGMNGLMSVCFNIYTKRFTLLHHPIVKNTPSAHHLWNGRVITSNSNEDSRSLSHKLIRSVNCCSGHGGVEDSAQLSYVPMYTTIPDNDNIGFMRRRGRVDLRNLPGWRNVGFTLNTNPRCGFRHNEEPGNLGVKRLVGDDNFLLFVDGGSHSVWSFENDRPGQLVEDRRSRWWKKI